MLRSLPTSLVLVLLVSVCGLTQEFQPNWESLNRRPLPAWKDRGHGRSARIVDWTDPTETVSGAFDITVPGTFDVEVTYAASPGTKPSEFRSGQDSTVGSRFKIELGEQQLNHQTVNTGGDERFRNLIVGKVEIPEPGRHTIVVRPDSEAWLGVGLQAVQLIPSSD
jgi:hypothetical protein